MNIILDNSSGKPLYEQIKTQIASQILSGALPAGFALPSMRALAGELHVSLITTKRTYEELEREGLIETIIGKGSFVATMNLEQARSNQMKAIKASLIDIVKHARAAGICVNELIKIMEDENGQGC
ncbi:MAG: GntR family transcriptional regulator [Clostridiales Family XIII bacterium]|jgi:GntR family transcriptional regulator|nr:GntR family transcriptional regulator [Clostridiales Family XIII bacterium]